MVYINDELIVKLRKKANALPLTPGVYLMKDKLGNIIYVGKSKSMKNRVTSYFTDVKNHNAKTLAMVSRVCDFDYMLTDSNIEALALENRLIKLHKPKFNIKLKDAKTYPYIKLTLNRDYPALTFTRKRSDDGAKYFGPFSGAATAISLMKTAQKAFGLASCNRVFPRDIGKERPCIYKQIGQCSAPCDQSVSKEEYLELNKKAAAFLRGSFGSVKRELEEQMMRAADELNFEAAAKLRDRIKALDACRQTQKVVGAPDEEKDVIAYYSDDLCSAISVFFVREGSIVDSETEVFSAEKLLESNDIIAYLCDFYLKREFIPSEISLDFKLSQDETDELRDFLEIKCTSKVNIKSPEKGNAKKLCAMVKQNAREHAERFKNASEKQNEIAIKLATLLSLEVVPECIEAYDISNMGADNITAGKISILSGKFNKSAYRTFKIRSTDTPDDYASMCEAIKRRISHTDDPFPDLILLDGGKGHVSAVKQLLFELDCQIPVFGMVKDDFHKTRALTTEADEISIAKETAVFNFIYKIQDEVHRYTFGKMQKAKRKSVKKSILTDISGIGPAKAKALITHFKSVDAIKNASRDEIAHVKGMNKKDVDTVWSFFQADKEKSTL